ncbi:MAG: DUF3108 domain-containing protein [Chloroflexota bacterium]
MKRVALLVLTSILLIVVAGCTASPASSPSLTLNAAPWKDGDKLAYDWLDKNGAKIGTSEATFVKDGSVWVLSNSDKIGNVDQTSKVRVDGTTLKPLGGEKTIKAQGTDAKIDTSYEGGNLKVTALVNGEQKSGSVDVPANALDNDQMLHTLRALPFAQGYEAKFVNVVSQNAAKVDTVVRVQAKEQVQVPAGTFEAWKVEADFGQTKQYAWYQVDAPHTLLQYDNGQTKLVLAK